MKRTPQSPHGSPEFDIDVERRRWLAAAALAGLSLPTVAAEPAATQRPKVGLWLRLESPLELDQSVALLAKRNERFVRSGRGAPWIGLLFSQTWGQIEAESGQWHLTEVRRVLDGAKAAGLGIVLQISDKSWQYKAGDEKYAPALPRDLDKGPVGREAFAQCDHGLCQDDYRYVTMQDMTAKGRRGSAVRKYVAKRWAVRDRWFAMWAALGQAVGGHPALAAVLTPESALALPRPGDQGRIGYPGPDWFVTYLLDQARTIRKAFPATVQVVSNVNSVPPNNAATVPRVVEGLRSEGLSIWAQDLNPGGGASKTLYPLLKAFPVEHRWAMVTNTSTASPVEMIKLAQSLGIGNLAFLSAKFEAQVQAVEQIERGKASFLPR